MSNWCHSKVNHMSFKGHRTSNESDELRAWKISVGNTVIDSPATSSSRLCEMRKVMQSTCSSTILFSFAVLFSIYQASNGDIFINYLNSIRELYSVIVKKEFDLEDAWEKVEQFKKCFQKVHVYGVSETLKESIQILYPRLHFKWCII